MDNFGQKMFMQLKDVPNRPLKINVIIGNLLEQIIPNPAEGVSMLRMCPQLSLIDCCVHMCKALSIITL